MFFCRLLIFSKNYFRKAKDKLITSYSSKPYAYWDIFHVFFIVVCWFFSKSIFWKFLSRILSECQTVWILIRPDKMSGLIWLQTVCKSYQQTTLVGNELTLFPTFTTIVACSLICLYSWETYFANSMNPDQTSPFVAVWSGFIVFASMIKISLKGIWIYAADIISRQHIKDNNLLVE